MKDNNNKPNLQMSIFVLLGLMLLASSGSAEELPFTHYTPQDVVNPLPSSTIYQTYQDSQGYIWFVVYSSGLVRYDGRTMTLYTPANGLPDVTAAALAETPEGHLWVGGKFGMAVSDQPIGDYASGQPLQFTTTPQGIVLTKGSIFNHNQVTVDHNGALWVGTATDGLWHYQYQNNKLASQQFSTDFLNQKKHDAIGALTLQAGGSVWFTTKTSVRSYALNRITPESNQIEKIAVLPTKITTLSFYANAIWIGAKDGRMWRYQPDSRTLTPLSQFSKSRVTQLWQSPDNTLWVITRKGIYQLNTETMQPKITINQKQGLLSNALNHIMQDQEGNLWISQNGGISKLPHNYLAFGYYTARYHSQQPPALPAAIVNAILPPDSLQPLWIGTENGLLSPKTNAVITQQKIMSICKDQQDNLWFGTGKSIYRLATKAQTAIPGMQTSEQLVLFDQPYTLEQLDLNIVINNCLQRLLPNGNNILWFTTKQHLYAQLFQQTTPEPNWFSFGTQSGLPRAGQTGAALDDHKNLWVGTMGKGLYRSTHNLSSTNLQTLETKPAEVTGKHVITQVFKRTVSELNGVILGLLWHQNLLWVGTDQGLALVDTNNETIIRRITMENGLQDNAVVSLAADPTNNHVWIGTNKGLAEIDPSGERVLRTLTRKDGLVGQETMWLQSVAVSADGTVYMGSDQGVTRYSPKFHKSNPTPPQMAFRSIRLSAASDGTNAAVFRYAALSFANEHQNQFKTQLLGYDKDWSTASEKNERNYTNLPAYFFPKSYSFAVMGSNNDAVWSQPIHYRFTIQPAWWLRWWAVLLFAGLALTAGYILYRYKTHKQAERIAQLQQVDKMKDEFLANTSHELRTPLNGIIGIAESLLDGVAGPVSDKMRENLSMIGGSGRRLANLVNDILDLSKLQKGDMILQKHAVNLYKIAENVLFLSRGLMGGKTLILENRIPPDLPLAEADENRLQQVFFNLLGNAIKFTESGSVVVSATVADAFLKITVTDTGIGIPTDKLADIFKAFEQVDASTAREYGGTGLGLSVTKQLVEQHGGQLSVTSEPGAGSAFTFTVPVTTAMETPHRESQIAIIRTPVEDEVQVASPPEQQDQDKLGDQPTILVVDDELVNRQVIKNHLEMQQFRIEIAEDGPTALAKIKAAQDLPDLILLDVMMPRMTGYEVCQILRQDYPAHTLPIIILTAKNQLVDLLQGFASGANDYLTKPFSKQELLARVDTHLKIAKLASYLDKTNNQLNCAIEELNQANNELSFSVRELSHAMHLKNALMANMNHEFNTPLNAILLYSEMVQEEMEDDGVRTYLESLENIHSAGLNLKNLLHRILQVIHIESESLQVEMRTFPFKQLMDQALSLIEAKVATNKNRLRVEYTQEIGEIRSDFSKLQQTLFNLLDNATKFTKAGTIVVIIGKVQHDKQDWVEIIIRDTGIGITQEQLDLVFRVFTQADSSKTRAYGGLGIGLTIVKAFSDLLGGHLRLESEKNKGTTVYYEFPADGVAPEQKV